jgi:hypothetical protein
MFQIDYPYRIDARGRTAAAEGAALGDDRQRDEHVRDLIEQLLFTHPGERVNRPDFGSGLLQMVFQPNSVELAASLQFTVQAALQQWLGDRITVEQVRVAAEDSKLRVTVRYRLSGGGEARTVELERAV